MALIRIHDLELPALIGTYPHEREAPQTLWLDLEIEVGEAACASDELADAVDYDALASSLRVAAADTRFYLLERLAGHLMDVIMGHAGIRRATLTLGKPGAIAHARTVEFVLTRQR